MTEAEEFEFRHRLEQEQPAPKRQSPKMMKIGAEGFEDAFREEFKSRPGWERGLAAAASFPSDLYQGTKQIFGKEDKSVLKANEVMSKEEPVSAALGGAASMVPLSAIPGANTIAGATALGGLTGILSPVREGESRGMNMSVDAMISGGTQAALKGAGIPLSKLLQRGESQALAKAGEQSVRDATLSEGRAAGYVVPRSATGQGGVGTTVTESVGGRGALNREASVKNQQVTNRIAKEEAGLGPKENLTEKTLAAARERMAEPYREVAAVSPRAKEALTKLGEARKDLKDARKKYFGPSGGPEERRAFEAAESKVNALEKLIDKEAGTVGKPDLLKRLREARASIAKNHDVETALNVGNGNVDAHAIGKMLDKRGEKGVTGGLQTIGKFAEAFPDFTREPPSGQVGATISALKYPAAAILGFEGDKASEGLGLGHYGAAAAALPLLAGPARSIALSKLMQGTPQYGPSTLRMADKTLRSPLIPYGAIPLAEVANQ